MDLAVLEASGVRIIRTRDFRYDERSGNALPIYDKAREERIKGHIRRIQSGKPTSS